MKEEDFLASTEETHEEPQLMLKTGEIFCRNYTIISALSAHLYKFRIDMCFWIDSDMYYPCCSRTNRWLGESNRCDWEETFSDKECDRYASDDTEMEAVKAVVDFLGGGYPNENNDPFYQAFASAWFKATTNGHDGLKAIRSECW